MVQHYHQQYLCLLIFKLNITVAIAVVCIQLIDVTEDNMGQCKSSCLLSTVDLDVLQRSSEISALFCVKSNQAVKNILEKNVKKLRVRLHQEQVI